MLLLYCTDKHFWHFFVHFIVHISPLDINILLLGFFFSAFSLYAKLMNPRPISANLIEYKKILKSLYSARLNRKVKNFISCSSLLTVQRNCRIVQYTIVHIHTYSYKELNRQVFICCPVAEFIWLGKHSQLRHRVVVPSRQATWVGKPVRQPYAGVDFVPQSWIYEFGYWMHKGWGALNC